MHLEVITPPAEEPVALEAVKLHLRVDGDDEDDLISALITSSREHVEKYCGIALITQTVQLTIDAFIPVIRLPRSPVADVTRISYVNGVGEDVTVEAEDNTLWRFSQASMQAVISPFFGSSWPCTANVPGAVQIQYTAGYGAATSVPQAIKQALLLLVGHWYKTREAAGEQLSEPPFAVSALLAPYVVPVV